ncbi:MAG: hypothetical protein IBX55_01310 [Methyloprofundus sp.]|nr:hypothetical protein [Methyloprofundus sp.]
MAMKAVNKGTRTNGEFYTYIGGLGAMISGNDGDKFREVLAAKSIEAKEFGYTGKSGATADVWSALTEAGVDIFKQFEGNLSSVTVKPTGSGKGENLFVTLYDEEDKVSRTVRMAYGSNMANSLLVNLADANRGDPVRIQFNAKVNGEFVDVNAWVLDLNKPVTKTGPDGDFETFEVLPSSGRDLISSTFKGKEMDSDERAFEMKKLVKGVRNTLIERIEGQKAESNQAYKDSLKGEGEAPKESSSQSAKAEFNPDSFDDDDNVGPAY